jgi:small GTP-binding protein
MGPFFKTKAFVQASCDGIGALGVFQVYAAESELSAALDLRLGGEKNSRPGKRLQPTELAYGWLRDGENNLLDEIVLACPETGVRILTSHGGRLVGHNIRNYLQQMGFQQVKNDSAESSARLGEMDDRLDPFLAQCLTPEQAAAVLEFRAGRIDFPIELLRTHRLMLAGPPNVGKSSLMNRLAGYERAFVHSEAGATRDVVEEMIDLGGFVVRISDLPGFSPAAGGLELEAGNRAAAHLRQAGAVAFVCDSSRPWGKTAEAAAGLTARLLREGPAPAPPILLVLNKSDLPPRLEDRAWERHFPDSRQVRLCSLPGGDAREKMSLAVYRLWGEDSAQG